MQTIQNVIKDTSPSQEHPQSSSTPATTPEMSSIFERVLDVFKLIRFQPNFKHGSPRAFADNPQCHQGHKPRSGTSKSSSTPARTLEMSSIFEVDLDAFKLIRFQPNFKHSFTRACGDHPKCHQGHQHQSGTSTIIIISSKNTRNVIHL